MDARKNTSTKDLKVRSLLYLTPWQKFCKSCGWFVDHSLVSLFTTVLTIYALVGDDIRVARTSIEADSTFNVFTMICLIVFTLEILLNSLGKDSYLLGFFFTLDILSTGSLILDLTYVAEALFGGGGGGDSGAKAARAGRASKAGARAGRVVRIIRLIRLIRIVKLYKTYQQLQLKREMEAKMAAEAEKTEPGDGQTLFDDNELLLEEEEEEEGSEEPESKVGKKLSDLTTRKVIILVLAMLFMIPQFSTGSHKPTTLESPYYMLDSVAEHWLEYYSVCSAAGPSRESNYTVALVRRQYEAVLVAFLYYHNWWSPQSSEDCPGETCYGTSYKSSLFWIGLKNSSSHVNDPCWSSGAVSLQLMFTQDDQYSWEAFNQQYNNVDYSIYSGEIPISVFNTLAQPWDTDCEIGSDINTGTSLISGVLCPTDLRFTERSSFSPVGVDEETFVAYFDQRVYTKTGAKMNLLQTLFVCVVLALGSLLFSKDANDMVLRPIERMVDKMDRIRIDPLYATKLGDDDFKEQEKKKKQQEWDLKHGTWFVKVRARWRQHQSRKSHPMETVILEKTIIKIGGLLVVGFGEAGTEIIGQNMKGVDAGVNALIPGRTVTAIFGFCNIRNFSDATEVLTGKVMKFVNQVSEIVHGIVSEFSGVANKNIGDAFLIAWRVSTQPESKWAKIADLAVMSFVKINIALNRSPTLAEYREHPGLMQRMSNYRVKMGFGLHLGWAIEGAIGSEFKIDASYLSPNVNISSRLQAATEQYQVTILCSDSLIQQCTPKMREFCRIVDYISVKGSKIPFRVFVVDLDLESLQPFVPGEYRGTRFNVDPHSLYAQYKLRMLRDQRKKSKMEGEEMEIGAMWEEDEDLVTVRKRFSSSFFTLFDMGFRNYEMGEWEVASSAFQTTLTMLEGPEDGPSRTLLNFMKENQTLSDSGTMQAPPTWKGYRQLMFK